MLRRCRRRVARLRLYPSIFLENVAQDVHFQVIRGFGGNLSAATVVDERSHVFGKLGELGNFILFIVDKIYLEIAEISVMIRNVDNKILKINRLKFEDKELFSCKKGTT